LHLDHSSPQALRESLINGEGNSRLFTVVPNNPAMSYLLNKLRGTQDQVVNGGGGDQMPPGGGYLEAVQIDQIEAWIVAGATADCP
jgi:mono/diheme cytochrome c family protein